MTKKYGLVCHTIFMGMTMSKGDIYDTKEEAEAEHLDMKKSREEADMDEDDDFAVMELQLLNEAWCDEYGTPITITDAEA